MLVKAGPQLNEGSREVETCGTLDCTVKKIMAPESLQCIGIFTHLQWFPSACESCVALMRDFSLLSNMNMWNSRTYSAIRSLVQTMAKLFYYRWGIPDFYYLVIYKDMNLLCKAERHIPFFSFL